MNPKISASSGSQTPTRRSKRLMSKVPLQIRDEEMQDLDRSGDYRPDGLVATDEEEVDIPSPYARLGRSPKTSKKIERKSSTSPRKLKQRPSREWPNVALLIVLYLLQGVPLGLAMGSVPFLLKKKLGYAELAIFSLTSYPYSLKLLWSPIVDSLYLKSIGRRRSWIIPIQLIIGLTLYVIGHHINDMIESPMIDIHLLTAVFMILVFLSATQDIAVDGWALTLLSKENLSLASTSQTIGLNSGYFLSFTVFLALNSERSIPAIGGVVDLGSFFLFWSGCYVLVTVWLIFFKTEGHDPQSDIPDNIKSAYVDIWNILKLPNMQTFVAVLLTAKIGFIANDAVSGFKLLEKGFKEEDLALTVLINFPLQIIFGYYAARWSGPPRRLRPWLYAFYGRLVMSLVAMGIISMYPKDGVNNSYFGLVIASSVISSFLSTVQFVSIGAFFAVIADPTIGGTYMTLLNTLSNFGGTYPQYFILKAVDYLTKATCGMCIIYSTSKRLIAGTKEDCSSKELKQLCEKAGSKCIIENDGYYSVTIATFILAVIILFMFTLPKIRYLEKLPIRSWRLNQKKSYL